MCSRPGVSYSVARLGYFLAVLCALGHALLHKLMCCAHTHPNKPLIFPKNPDKKERILRAHWSPNKSEEFVFKNTLESF